jgi:hypothetical protein
LGVWQQIIISLLDENNQPLWYAAPVSGSSNFLFIDVVIIPFNITDEIIFYPVLLEELSRMRTVPCSQATILGYPGGKSSYKYLPIWITGYIASEPQLDYADLPIMLVNAATTGGMSGSPVFQIADGNYFDSSGNYCIAASRVCKFLGVYSGRMTTNQLLEDLITNDSQSSRNALSIGLIWKPSVIDHLINHYLQIQSIKSGI